MSKPKGYWQESFSLELPDGQKVRFMAWKYPEERGVVIGLVLRKSEDAFDTLGRENDLLFSKFCNAPAGPVDQIVNKMDDEAKALAIRSYTWLMIKQAVFGHF